MENVTTVFVMTGAREVLDGGGHIRTQVEAIEDAMTSNPGYAIDLARAIVESTCKTILTECGCESDDTWDAPRLLNETLGHIQIVPDNVDNATEAVQSLKLTLRGIRTLVQGMSELRNSFGFVSHGKPANFQQLERAHAELAARSADALVSFLFRCHRAYTARPIAPESAYGDHPAFDDYVDELHTEVELFDLVYRPSEVLFRVDIDAYRDHLTDFAPDVPVAETAMEV